jgi:2-polyprenyl-3-methyl-5-hydroxy-6-metoxy-1,4-benzoquinol methylase
MIPNLIIKKIRKPIHHFVKACSYRAVYKAVNDNKELQKIWNKSFEHFPDFYDHFTNPVDDKETEARIRHLVVNEALFVKEILDVISLKKISYADIGDSDGSVRILLSDYFSSEQLETTGINLQIKAVEKIRKLGLNAICADAMDLGEQNIKYDIVSLFETLEHLKDPIGFLTKIHPIVKNKLIISVPYAMNSKIRLQYLEQNWPSDKKATIENQHIFELAPTDWGKIFKFTGWKISHQKVVKPFPNFSLYRLLLQPYWRYISYDGFWFVALEKDDTYSSKYIIE